MMLGGVEKNNGDTFSPNEKNITFIVTSNYNNRFWVEDLLQQNGLKRRVGCSFVSGWVYAANGWSIQEV